jgi:hypothetical protein
MNLAASARAPVAGASRGKVRRTRASSNVPRDGGSFSSFKKMMLFAPFFHSRSPASFFLNPLCPPHALSPCSQAHPSRQAHQGCQVSRVLRRAIRRCPRPPEEVSTPSPPDPQTIVAEGKNRNAASHLCRGGVVGRIKEGVNKASDANDLVSPRIGSRLLVVRVLCLLESDLAFLSYGLYGRSTSAAFALRRTHNRAALFIICFVRVLQSVFCPKLKIKNNKTPIHSHSPTGWPPPWLASPPPPR